MSAAVICDECGRILKDTDALHCHVAVVSTNSHSNLVYGADICKDCQSKFNMKYDCYGWHARPKEAKEALAATKKEGGAK